MNEKTHKTLHNYAIIWPMWWSRDWVTIPRPRVLGSNPGCVMNVVLIGCVILTYQRLDLEAIARLSNHHSAYQVIVGSIGFVAISRRLRCSANLGQ